MNEVRDHKNALTAPEVRVGANGQRMITGYGIVFNSDSANLGGFIEQVDPSAVTKTLAEADIRGIANHNTDWTLGRVKSGTMRLSTDSRGVRYEIDVNPNDPDGQRALAKVERGDWDGSSFCFETVQEAWDWDATPARRRLLEIKLIEMGPVAFPAYPDSTAAARALSKVAAKLGHKPERMVEALAAGEIRSLLDKAAETIEVREYEPETVLEAMKDAAVEEFRVGKRLSTETMTKLRDILGQIQTLMGDMDAPDEPDGDEYPRSLRWMLENGVFAPEAREEIGQRLQELRAILEDGLRAITTDSFTGNDPEPETPEDKTSSLDVYRAKIALREHAVSDLFAKYDIDDAA